VVDLGGDIPILPLVGASSVEQLDDSLAAVDLTLTPEQRAKLDGVN
jgi:aryl-alcohol dehydrogenase-like predicted oxidoreductase